MRKNFDVAAKYGLDVEVFPVTLTSGAQATLPTGPITNRTPIGVTIVDGALGSLTVTASSWDTSSGTPRITPTFSAAGTRDCIVLVFYKR